MKTAYTKPPECCVIIEMEPGTSIGYRRAVLLNEIEALESITYAAMTSRIPPLPPRPKITCSSSSLTTTGGNNYGNNRVYK